MQITPAALLHSGNATMLESHGPLRRPCRASYPILAVVRIQNDDEKQLPQMPQKVVCDPTFLGPEDVGHYCVLADLSLTRIMMPSADSMVISNVWKARCLFETLVLQNVRSDKFSLPLRFNVFFGCTRLESTLLKLKRSDCSTQIGDLGERHVIYTYISSSVHSC